MIIQIQINIVLIFKKLIGTKHKKEMIWIKKITFSHRCFEFYLNLYTNLFKLFFSF
jgi:hypothetical protein